MTFADRIAELAAFAPPIDGREYSKQRLVTCLYLNVTVPGGGQRWCVALAYREGWMAQDNPYSTLAEAAAAMIAALEAEGL